MKSRRQRGHPQGTRAQNLLIRRPARGLARELLDVDPEDPMQMDESVIPLYGTELWNGLSEARRAELRYHSQVFNLSQFLHGEQGALICTAKIVETVPWYDAKLYASTQVVDEARHVEVFAKYIEDKLGGNVAGKRFTLTWTYHPKPLNTAVANSALIICPLPVCTTQMSGLATTGLANGTFSVSNSLIGFIPRC